MRKLVMLLLLLIVSCSTAMKLTPIKETERIISVYRNIDANTENNFHIKSVALSDSFLAKYPNNIDFSTLNIPNVLKYNSNYKYSVEIELNDLYLDDSSIKNFFIQSYGFWIGMPWWNGLSYKYNVRYTVKIYSSLDANKVLINKYTDTYILNYLSETRSRSNAICGALWIPTLSATSCINAIIPTTLDNEELNNSIILCVNTMLLNVIPIRVKSVINPELN